MKKLILFIFINFLYSITYDFTFAVLKYRGGDWYEGRVGVKELINFIKKNSNLNINPEFKVIGLEDPMLYKYPFIYLTGHGNIKFNKQERIILKKYLLSGGFLYANDDFGIDKNFRREIKNIFPDKKFVLLPDNHRIYNIFYKFPLGLPKIHKHYGGKPKGFALYHNKRIIIYYTYNTDIGDGWAPYQVHKDPPEKRLAALKMGLNIILYSMNN